MPRKATTAPSLVADLPDTFVCHDCGKTHPINKSGALTLGFAYLADTPDARICYACCAERDRQHLLDGKDPGLYFDSAKRRVTNWPGSLSIPVNASRKSRHNISRGGRIDFWFTGPDGRIWHGTTFPDAGDYARVRVTKGRRVCIRCGGTNRTGTPHCSPACAPAPTLAPHVDDPDLARDAACHGSLGAE